MFVAIPLISFYFLFLIFYQQPNRLDGLRCWRRALLSASVGWGVILVGITESLSLLSMITFKWLVLAWGLVFITSVLIYGRLEGRQRLMVRFPFPKISPSQVLALFGISFIVIVVGLIALVAPPNTWDSMTYHLSRIFHWIQNHNINYYPTHIIRQLAFTPGAEFIVMHFQILTGGDRLANLVQWFSMLASIIGVSLIAKELGADKSGQLFSALVCASIPVGILQGSSTQNDYLVSFWMLCFVYYLLLIIKGERGPLLLFMAGTSLGLALLTKGTAYLYALPFLIWLAFSGFKRSPWNLYRALLIIIIMALFINCGYYIRNLDLYGRIYPRQLYYLNDSITLPLLISNIVRNLALHLGGPFNFVNDLIYNLVTLINKVLGVAVNDPRITAAGTFFRVKFLLHEDSAGNFLHLILIIAAVAVFFITGQKRKGPDPARYLAALAGTFFLLCLVVKWQPWGSRFHLPLFVLFSPVIAIVFSRINNPFRRNRTFLILAASWSLSIGLACLWYNRFGHQLVEAIYKGQSAGLLNTIIEKQASHPLAYYIKTADAIFIKFLVAAVGFLFIMPLLRRFKKAMEVVAVILILISLPWIFYNAPRRLIGKGNIFSLKRTDQYFSNRPELRKPYLGAVEYIASKGYSEIGLILGEDDWEYPFIVLLEKGRNQPIRIEHLKVINESSIKYSLYPFNNFNPSVIISLGPEENDKIVYNQLSYIKEWSDQPVGLFVRR